MKKVFVALAVLGTMFSLSVKANADTTEEEVSVQTPQVRGISVYERGVLKINGDVNNYGVGYYGYNNAKGVLSLNYYAQYGLGLGIADQTYYTLKLPQEFEEISSTPEFKKAVSGCYSQKAVGIRLKQYNYMQQDIQIVDNTIIFKNPRFSYIVEARIHCDVQIDLGKFITTSGLHIPNSECGYRFMGTNVQNTNLLNWNIFNGTDADKTTNTAVLDFMYQ